MHTMTDECRYCAAPIYRAGDGAWCDHSGACGCGEDEHEPGGFDEWANFQRARDTPWWEDVPHPVERGWDAAPDTRDVRPDGPAFAESEVCAGTGDHAGQELDSCDECRPDLYDHLA